MSKIIPHHIVGVHVFVLCNFANSVALPMVASSLICFQILYFISNSINNGIIISQTKNVIIENENIGIKCEFINIINKF